MNVQRVLFVVLILTVLSVVGLSSAKPAHAYHGLVSDGSAGDWPAYPGYPAYGGWYHNVHLHHYVYRPHNWQWHPAGWAFLGPYGGWYGGGLPWHGPGNCGVGAPCGLYYDGTTVSESTTTQPPEGSTSGSESESVDDLPELPEFP